MLTGRVCGLLACVGLAWAGVPQFAGGQTPSASSKTPQPSRAPAAPPATPPAKVPDVDVPSLESLDGGETAHNALDAANKAVDALFTKCKSAVVRILATDDYGTHGGTGFFIDPNGTIYSHYWVAGRSWDLTVEFADKKYPATCLLADPRSGVALLKIQAGPTPFLPIGNSAELTPNTPVITVGYPMDLPASPNLGFVVRRDQKYQGRYLPTTHIQIKVPVQSGELGSPIIDTKGRAVGILAFTSDGAACEALPIQAAEKVRNDFTRFGEPRYGWIGVTAEPVNEGDENCEVKVSHLDDETPAAHSGLKDGDVLVSVGAKEIKKFGDLRDASFFLTADDLVPITVKRDDKVMKVDVRAASPPSKVAANSTPAKSENGTRLSLPQTP